MSETCRIAAIVKRYENIQVGEKRTVIKSIHFEAQNADLRLL